MKALKNPLPIPDKEFSKFFRQWVENKENNKFVYEGKEYVIVVVPKAGNK